MRLMSLCVSCSAEIKATTPACVPILRSLVPAVVSSVQPAESSLCGRASFSHRQSHHICTMRKKCIGRRFKWPAVQPVRPSTIQPSRGFGVGYRSLACFSAHRRCLCRLRYNDLHIWQSRHSVVRHSYRNAYGYIGISQSLQAQDQHSVRSNPY